MRLASLDVLRGSAVVGMILVNSAAAMNWTAKGAVYPLLLHSEWNGLTLADFVFPAFLTMVGVSIPFSLRSASIERGAVLRILSRAGRLLLLGFLLSNLYWFQDFRAGDWRLLGVLQRIGLVYGASAMLFLGLSARARLAIAATLLLLYWLIVLLPSGDGLVTDLWTRGHNFAGYVDRFVLGPHLYVRGPEGYDPEGILGTLPALAQGLIGVAVGERLAKQQEGGTGILALAGGVMLAAGLAWSLVFPIVKDIWSSSFVLVTSGATILALAGFHAWLDRPGELGPGARAVTALALPFGANAIAAYTLHMVTAGMVRWQLLLVPYGTARPLIGDAAAALLPLACYLAFLWAVMSYFRRRAWIAKI
jgi:predicted acyltransferase